MASGKKRITKEDEGGVVRVEEETEEEEEEEGDEEKDEERASR